MPILDILPNQKTIVQTVDSLKTDEEIINGYLNGTITGIYVRPNCFFINLRVTGLGITKRLDEEKSANNLIKALNQFKDIPSQELDFKGICDLAISKGLQPYNFIVYKEVDRKEQDFASQTALDLYAGLPILLDHPEEGLLSFDNLVYNSIVGSVIKAYKLNNSVFAVARIYDLNLIDKLNEFKSTSPAVVSVDVEDNGLLKERPIIFNHLAFVRRGHWDQISDYAIDGSKIQIEGDNMAITEVVAANADSITDVVSTPEAKEIKTDEVESVLEPETSAVDNAVEVDESEVETAVDADDLAAVDADDLVAVDADDLAHEAVDADDLVAVDADDLAAVDADDLVAVDADDLAHEAVDEGITDVTKTVECDEDKERANLIDAMRSAVDSASTLKDVKMPYIEGRKKPSYVIKALLRSNRQYVDSKFQGLIDQDVSYKNYALCIDAFNNMLANIREADEANHSYIVKSEVKGWSVAGDNPNILIDKSF